jgi:hypothetical protein
MYNTGTSCRFNDKMEYVLFDPMTHTVNGQSCAGDHGLDGIANFVEYHECNQLCQGLDLASLSVLSATIEDHRKKGEVSKANALREYSDDEDDPAVQRSRRLRQKSTLSLGSSLHTKPDDSDLDDHKPGSAAFVDATEEFEDDEVDKNIAANTSQ